MLIQIFHMLASTSLNFIILFGGNFFNLVFGWNLANFCFSSIQISTQKIDEFPIFLVNVKKTISFNYLV